MGSKHTVTIYSRVSARRFTTFTHGLSNGHGRNPGCDEKKRFVNNETQTDAKADNHRCCSWFNLYGGFHNASFCDNLGRAQPMA
jgi:hypothetical protein